MIIFISRLLYLLAIVACIYFLIRFLQKAIKTPSTKKRKPPINKEVKNETTDIK